MGLDPNSVKRYKHRIEAMEQNNLGEWVKIHDYWELKDAWIKQNMTIDSAVKTLREEKEGHDETLDFTTKEC